MQREKDKEKERREQGRNIAKVKEMQVTFALFLCYGTRSALIQAEQRNKNWMAERQKQKEEARLAREEIRAKLEQDRREREDRQRSGMIHTPTATY